VLLTLHSYTALIHIHTYTHTLIQSYPHALIHSYTHTLIHSYTHTLIHSYTHTLLLDQGVATAAEIGVFGPEGRWLIEGHGVDPDESVDNRPHETFNGQDAQLDAAVAHLLRRMEETPVETPESFLPRYPDKSRGAWRPSGAASDAASDAATA
jgi:hypothetical protein